MKTLTSVLLLCLLQDSPPEPEVKQLASGMGFTEGPVWIPAENALVFSDIPNAKLMRWSSERGLEVFRESENANGNLLDLQGRLLSAQHGARNIVRQEADGSLVVLADRFEGKRLNSPNDLAIQSDGTLWFTDPPWGLMQLTEGKELDGHYVFRLSPDGEPELMLDDLVMPNGIALAPDESRLYVADTGGNPRLADPELHARPATLSAYDLGPQGELSTKPIWRVETLCDGMCVDARGRIYATGEKGVSIWTPAGEPAGFLPVPEHPANVCFGGEDFRTLFITARTSLYAAELDVEGSKPRNAKW